MNDVERQRPLGDGLEKQRVRDRRIGTIPALRAERPRADRDELRAAGGVTAGEQRHLVSAMHQLLGEVRDDALDPRRTGAAHRLVQRRYLRDPHARPSDRLPLNALEKADPRSIRDI